MDTSGCFAWFDASDTTNFTLLGSNVLQWNSKVGSNVSLQPNFTYFRSPEYITSSKAVYFDNGPTQDAKIYPGIQQLETLTPIQVDYSNVQQTAYIVANILDGTCIGFNSALRVSDNTTFEYQYQFNKDDPNNAIRYIGGFDIINYSSNVFPRNQPFLMSYTSQFTGPTTNSSSLYVNSVNISNVVGGSFVKPSFGTIPIYLSMAGGLMTGGRTFTGYIHEVALYNTFHTDAQRQSIEKYLMDKWNINNTFQLKKQFILYQYIPIEPILVSAQGIGQVDIFVDSATLPNGLRFDNTIDSIIGSPSKLGTYEVIFYARDDRGITTLTLEIVVILPTIMKKQTSAGAYTSLVRQYTEVNAAQNSINNLVYPNQEQTLGEFTAPNPPDTTKDVFNPCVTPQG